LEIGKTVSYLEAIYLVSILRQDPSSWLQAAMSNWKHPVSREWIAQVHTYDLTARVNSKQKPKPYPVPWPESGTQKIGSNKQQSREKTLSILARMNPKEN
jgi:hypothetical protein